MCPINKVNWNNRESPHLSEAQVPLVMYLLTKGFCDILSPLSLSRVQGNSKVEKWHLYGNCHALASALHGIPMNSYVRFK